MTESASASRRWLTRGLAAGALTVVVALAATWLLGSTGESATASYRYAKVTRGPVKSIVSASGSLRPVVTVLVGSQVSGQIKELKADFNSPVKANEVIARLDPAAFEAKVWQAEADLKIADANVGMQSAALAEMTAEIEAARSVLTDADQDLTRKKELFQRRVVAESVVDKAVAVKEQAAAKLRAAEAKLRTQQAQVEHARAAVEEKKAQLRQRQLDLEHTIIRSPVDGVVISRDVDVGQTVAASLQAPTLFTIARDLRQMQVEVSVDEADIGRVDEGQAVTFTVDAFPGREFDGQVTQIRKAPTEISNVVTYTVVVGANNPDLSLLPGMTANVSVVTGARESTLRIENAALRYRPADAEARLRDAGKGGGDRGSARLDRIMERLTQRLDLTGDQQRDIRAVFAGIGIRARAMRAEGAPAEEVRAAVEKMRHASRERVAQMLDERQRAIYRELVRTRELNPIERARVWVVGESGTLEPVGIAVGISDGSVTEIVRGPLAEGQSVVIGQTAASSSTQSRWRLGF